MKLLINDRKLTMLLIGDDGGGSSASMMASFAWFSLYNWGFSYLAMLFNDSVSIK
jgi:hypothetical protein